jgi:hypothetical protein
VHDPAILVSLPVLDGVQVDCVVDFYDGPVDGLARYHGRDWWFLAVSEKPAGAPSSPRVLVLHEISAEQAAIVRAESERFDQFANGEGDAAEWERAWDDRTTGDRGRAIGWIVWPDESSASESSTSSRRR